MTPEKTYELVISLSSPDAKPEVTSWLTANGFDEFVEGSIDNLDIDFDYSQATDRYYDDLGGAATPLIIYKYDRDLLEQLAVQLAENFSGRLNVVINAIDTSSWQEGWKESFKPFETDEFLVYPPWEKSNQTSPKMALEIEPGMAFGTGQHATTRLCLEALEYVFVKNCKSPFDHPKQVQVADIGTGTGILAIACMRLGVGQVEGTDIDTDAILAAKANADRNDVQPYFFHSSEFQPSPAGYELVIANILTVVLKRIFPQLDQYCQPGGYLLLSGILEEEVGEMLELASEHQMTLVRRKEGDGWACLLLQKHVGEKQT